MPSERETAFAVWLTGLPASGKSTVARALAAELAGKGIRAAVLESDAVRREITPKAAYGEAERDAFYATVAYLARMLVLHGVPVIVDATANRRVYRDRARKAIPRFLEVHVRCPLAVCQARDPKGIYRRGAEGSAQNVPGVSAPYEPPLLPEVVVDGAGGDPAVAARRIVSALEKKGILPRGPGDTGNTTDTG
jgi:adenylylsulfate kinase